MSNLRSLMRQVYSPRGQGHIASHLQMTYGVDVRDVAELDMGVYRVDLDDGRQWVARVFMPERTLERVQGDAELLAHLVMRDFPVERPVTNPVSVLDEQPVLVTEFVQGKVPGTSARMLTAIADGLGRLHATSRDGLKERDGGSLHHVPGFEGLPGQDLRLAAALLEDVRSWVPTRSASAFEALCERIAAADDCADLPRSLVHPDPVLKNMIAQRDRVTLVDWGGAGVGPRIASLAQLLGVARKVSGWDAAKLRIIADAYGAHVRLTLDEIDRIGAAMRMRQLWLAAWNYWTRTVTGNPPKGDEWWIRLTSTPDPTLPEVMRTAFQAD